MSSASAQKRAFKGTTCRYQLTAFFLVTYLLSWAFLIPAFRALLDAGWAQGGLDEIPPLAFIGIIGAFGPTLAAVALSWYQHGRTGVRRLLSRLLIWRVHPGWYLFALIAPALVFLLALLLSSVKGFPLGPLIAQDLVVGVLAAIAITLPFGPIPEELGWRGYALPRLLLRHGPIWASLVLGFFWTLWHVPAFFVPGVAIPSAFAVTPLTVVLYLLNNTTLSLIFTGVYLRTKGSVLLAILLHAGSNASSNIIYEMFPGASLDVSSMQLVYGANVALMGLVGVAMLIRTPRRLGSRQRSRGD